MKANNREPSERRELAVNHFPIEILPRTKILKPVLLFDLRSGLESAFPNIVTENLDHRYGWCRTR